MKYSYSYSCSSCRESELIRVLEHYFLSSAGQTRTTNLRRLHAHSATLSIRAVSIIDFAYYGSAPSTTTAASAHYYHLPRAQRGGRTCVLSMSWGHARGQDNARTVLITIGRILTGHIPTKLRKRLGQGFIPFLNDLFLSNTNCAMENGLHCLDAAPV